MLPKNYHNFNRCDITKNPGAGKGSNSLFVEGYF